MAKAKKSERVISSVELKDPSQVIHLKNIGLKITAENLTVERYQKLIQFSHKYEQFFNVKLTNKPYEQSQVEAEG